ncbi:hypothetical protein K438DRAFT_1977926 [Mycena galopus ATCC 62051]|nr:hypothetical protein K438DRAFT_1977926 [Mycena galopus ATCC 62051]
MHSFRIGILLGLLTASALASGAATKVLTPGGYRLSTDVHEIPAGGRVALVGNDVHLIGADGTILYVAPNVTTATTQAAESGPPEQSGWITYASWLNTSPSPISNFSWATETLAAYGITAASDYPPGASAFYEINLSFAGPAPTVSWSVTNDEADGLFSTIDRDGAFEGVITITY